MFRSLVIVAVLSFGLLAGCGDSNNGTQAEVIDDILGGGTLNGCAAEDFDDLTGETSVTITDISAWGNPPQRMYRRSRRDHGNLGGQLRNAPAGRR